MKKLFSLFVLTSLFFASCKVNSDKTASTAPLGKMKELTDSEIGINASGKFKLSVDEKSIVTSAKEFYSMYNLGYEPINAKIVKIENKMYLRIFNKDNFVSTIELVLNSDNHYKTAKTICTSQTNLGGCVPVNNACMPTNNTSKSSNLNCSRTTTS